MFKSIQSNWFNTIKTIQLSQPSPGGCGPRAPKRWCGAGPSTLARPLSLSLYIYIYIYIFRERDIDIEIEI